MDCPPESKSTARETATLPSPAQNTTTSHCKKSSFALRPPRTLRLCVYKLLRYLKTSSPYDGSFNVPVIFTGTTSPALFFFIIGSIAFKNTDFTPLWLFDSF
jgi:hypothetical protein